MRQKCAVCSYAIHALDEVVYAQGDLMHVSCAQVLSAQATLSDARRTTRRSREIIEASRRAIQQFRARRSA